MKSYVVVKMGFFNENGKDCAMAINWDSDIAVFRKVEKAIEYIKKEIISKGEFGNYFENEFTYDDLRDKGCNVKYQAYQREYNSRNARYGYVVVEK